MRRLLILAALLVSGCATYAEGPGYAYPAYAPGYAADAAPAYVYRQPAYAYPTHVRRPHVYAPPKRHRASAPPAHRHRGEWQRRSDRGERGWQAERRRDGGDNGWQRRERRSESWQRRRGD